jgi:hypothetical protein
MCSQYLTKNLNEYDRSQIAEEVKRLFALQDKNITEHRIGYLVDEIDGLNAPIESILLGLRELGRSDVPHLKFSTIRTAIQSKFIRETKKSDCPHCNGRGFVCLRSVKKFYNIAFACICEAGDFQYNNSYNNHHCERWNGTDNQIYQGMEMIPYDKYLLG